MEAKELLRALEERLVQHDNNRKEVQDKLQDIYSESIKESDLLEEKLNEELQKYFNNKQERILGLIEELNNNTQKDDLDSLTTEALMELSNEPKFDIKHIKNADNFVNSYEVRITNIKLDINTYERNDNRKKVIIKHLHKHLDKIHKIVISVQNKITEICAKKRVETEELKKKIDGDLEGKFITEDNRLQAAISEFREKPFITTEDTFKAIQRVKTTLLVGQSYGIIKCDHESKGRRKEKPNFCLTNMYELKTERKIVALKVVDFEERKPSNLISSFANSGELSLSFTFFSDDEIEILKTATNSSFKVTMKIWEKNKSEEEGSKMITKEYNINGQQIYFYEPFYPSTTYNLKMRIEHQGLSSKWSDETPEFTTPDFSECIWKKCPNYVDKDMKYSLDKKNPKIATKMDGLDFCTIIGNTFLPLNKITSWNIKILKSRKNGSCIFIGVAPFDINQNEDDNSVKCGWYFDCGNSKLCSGPPHNYHVSKNYGLRKDCGKYIHTGDTVGVLMDTARGNLSFALDGVNYGVAYEGIPLDKPLVPCVILGNEGDSVELDTSSEVKEKLDSSVLVPLNITAKSETWDSITLAWNAVEGASFYQIEVDGSKLWDFSTINTFTKGVFLEESEHSFRVRTVKNNAASEWSDVVKGRTLKTPDFSECVWKECTDYVNEKRKYSVDENNHRIARNNYRYKRCDYCIITGNAPFPLNNVTSWNIKILKSLNNDGRSIYIGVAPLDINQNRFNNINKCGWYFHCSDSTLFSGPPHYYKDKEYGTRKKKGEYVHTGDSVGVIMDTVKGELSFVLNGINLGTAFTGIPLGKPLVPCVTLGIEGDSVELDTSEVKENVDSSIPAPSNITTKSLIWDSITLTWNTVERSSFYQIEVDGSKLLSSSTTNTFTKRGLLSGTEHVFRVRAVKGDSVSEWSDIIKGKVMKTPDFSKCIWKECPDYIDEEKKYIVDSKNSRIVTKINDHNYCTIIGNTPLPFNKVTSWSIKILKSKYNGSGIYIGVAPSDIDQNEGYIYNNCGWYFSCSNSLLYSGPPQNYNKKEYGPRKEIRHVNTGDTVGVVMDTTRGELSFALNGVNLGTAFTGIPLGKPLVPCVTLEIKGNSVELII